MTMLVEIGTTVDGQIAAVLIRNQGVPKSMKQHEHDLHPTLREYTATRLGKNMRTVTFLHKRDDGWSVCVRKALEALERAAE